MDKALQGILAKHKNGGNLLSLMKEVQQRYSHVPREFIREIAQAWDIPIGDIYGLITFHPFLSTKPSGKNVIRICKCLPCYLKGCQNIIEVVGADLGIKPGETTEDDEFSLELTNCIGACDSAPAMMINDRTYGNLTPEKVLEVLAEHK